MSSGKSSSRWAHVQPGVQPDLSLRIEPFLQLCVNAATGPESAGASPGNLPDVKEVKMHDSEIPRHTETVTGPGGTEVNESRAGRGAEVPRIVVPGAAAQNA